LLLLSWWLPWGVDEQKRHGIIAFLSYMNDT
jgi:hypothetical protein